MDGDNFEIICRYFASNGILHPDCQFREGVTDRLTGFKERAHLYLCRIVSRDVDDVAEVDSRRLYEFRVDYHESFQCPVLWMRPTLESDSSMISLDQVFDDFPRAKETLIEQRNQKISLDMHPVLNTPWYYLHPCQTSEMLNALTAEQTDRSEEKRDQEKMTAWLTIYFQPFGLELLHNSSLSKSSS